MPALLISSQQTVINGSTTGNPCGVDFVLEPCGDMTMSIIDSVTKKVLVDAIVEEKDIDFIKAFFATIKNK